MGVSDIIWIGGSSVEATHLLDFETDTGSLGTMMGRGDTRQTNCVVSQVVII